MKTNKRFLVRNLVWNKHFKHNENYEHEAEKILQLLKTDSRIKYSIFSIERGETQSSNSFHLQGYLEFFKVVDAVSFNKTYQFSDIQKRKGTQSQAIDYVKKPETKVIDKLFEFGEKKNPLERFNTKDDEIPNLMDDQRILLNHRLKDNYYKHFIDIEDDLELLFLKHTNWCKNLWDRYHPVQVLNTIPAQTIWIYGNSGIGKTTWTNQFLENHNYSNWEVSKKKASNEKRPILWFDLDDELKSVLWIEEIRENFPDFNDLIQIIDKGTRLQIKGSQINNNFELIILNSLHSPEYIYRTLPFGHQVEILRRLYKGNKSKVYQLIPNSENYNKLINKTKDLPKVLKIHFDHNARNKIAYDEVPDLWHGENGRDE